MDTNFIEDLPPGPLDAYRKHVTFNWKQMKLFFEDAELLKVKMGVWKSLENDKLFERPVVEPSTEEMKRITALRLQRYLQSNFVAPETANLPYRKKARRMMIINESLAAVFPDVSVKVGIGVLLFKNTLITLGTERHHAVLDAAWNGKILACFALTEVAHGSNTKAMRTTATYDEKTKEFIINTPDFEAAKCWIGNLGKACTMGLVFAQLYLNEQCYGLHAFVVPIRDPKTLLPYPGITVGDMGEKIALHGIDNGFVLFKDYRIPRENLLNRTADVTPEGEYVGNFTEPSKLLGSTLEALSAGRIAIIQECTNTLTNAVSIAVRYAVLRKQFCTGPDDSDEVPLIEYQLHQWRLFPYVAAAAVFKIFVSSFTEEFLETVEKSTSTKTEDFTKIVSEVHSIVSSAKPLITWVCLAAVQECRQACGGHGFLKQARFGTLREMVDPCVTYEGDNNVLGQQASNLIVRQWEQVKENKSSCPFSTCDFFLRHEEILQSTFKGSIHQDIYSLSFILQCYQWLITYLARETYNEQCRLIKTGKSKIEARNLSQVYRAATLTRAFAEYNALKFFSNKLPTAHISFLIELKQLGILYGLFCLEKHLAYFYQGGFATTPLFSKLVKEGVLEMCSLLKNSMVPIIDALAPPDYVLNSVLGRSDGKLYENIKTSILNNPGAMSRPSWWQDVIVPNAPDFKKPKSKL